MLNIKGRPAVVVGGGKIACRRTIGLLKAGAKVTVISPDIQEQMNDLWNENRVDWVQKKFEADDLHGAFIVIAATNSKEVNLSVAENAGVNQLVNIVDEPELSTFHVPATLTRGDLTISVATGGASPTLSRIIRSELEEKYDNSYVGYLDFLATVRGKLKQVSMDESMKIHYLIEITNESFQKSEEKQREFLEFLEGI
ncbi:precorrin-2 dehydrogenase [Psychrobacillus insolitus]|uniref:precorrin-2 dehydrogenase n=2 Tax=Psychrobacillus insolitus TaxID=1461 RepID=A0A2W7MGS2_9BACI|nr:precorrin-2 dehydrogenase [Psychrobacillus insolitus]